MVFDYLKELAGVGEGKKEAEKHPDKGVVVADTPKSIPTKEESKEDRAQNQCLLLAFPGLLD